jgi:hypothetical protein
MMSMGYLLLEERRDHASEWKRFDDSKAPETKSVPRARVRVASARTFDRQGFAVLSQVEFGGVKK